MNFTIKETFTCGKSISGYTEDRIVHSNNHFGILDGSPGPSAQNTDLISQILDHAVNFLHELEARVTLDELVDALTKLVAEHKAAAGVKDYRRTGGFGFCLYSRHFNELWRVADCQFYNGGVWNSNFWTTEKTCADARSMIIHSMLADGMSVDDIMTHQDYDHLISGLLSHEVNFLNRADDPKSFGAIIGLAVPTNYIERFEVAPGNLVITSDGYPKVCESLAETEAFLAEMLRDDPMCISQNTQCKGLGPNRVSFDDRSYIRAFLS